MWTLGRRGTGYKKLRLFQISWPFGMDGYLLRYDSGDYIPEHTDPVTDKNHYRLNIIIWQSGSGGTFVCEKPQSHSGSQAGFDSYHSEMIKVMKAMIKHDKTRWDD